jgi:2-haloacid dehalogenase
MATIAFDLNGTLLDPTHLASALDGDKALVLRALDLAIAQGMTLTLSRAPYRPFKELLQAGLERELQRAGRDPSAAADAVELTSEMPPFPEAERALDTLADAGHRLVVLTNSAAESAEQSLTNAGIRDRFDAVHGTDAVGAFKPDPRVYALLGDPTDVWLIAAHWWDIAGAGQAGLDTGWVARKEQILVPGTRATVTGADLADVAEQIVSRSSRSS